MIHLSDLTPEHLAEAGEILACDGSGWGVLVRRDPRLAPLVGASHPGSHARQALYLRVPDLEEATCRAAAALVRKIGRFDPATMAL